mgnify:CR=1 FL=1
MSRKNFMILSMIESILWIGAMVIGSMLDSKLWMTISMLIVLISLLHAAYVTIVKKSINLLAGMTEEQAVEIQRDPEKLKKYERITQVIGVTILVSALFLIYLIYCIAKTFNLRLLGNKSPRLLTHGRDRREG